MSMQDHTPRSIKLTNGELEAEQSVINSIINATPPPRSSARIHRVPGVVRETNDYEKYYVPKVVSIGPHHFGNSKLEFGEKLKPVFTMILLSNCKETLRSLYKKLGEPAMVQELRKFYDEDSTKAYCDTVLTKMMLLDCCFILYYIQFIFGGKPEDCGELKSHQIVFVHQDLFLLENQIPFKVLTEVMKLLKIDCLNKIKPFMYGNILASGRTKRKWLESILCIRKAHNCRDESRSELIDTEPDHLLHLLHRSLTKKVKARANDSSPKHEYRCTFAMLTR